MTGPQRTAAHHEAWLALALSEGVSARQALDLVEIFGGPEAVLAASPSALAAAGVPTAAAGALARASERAVAERDLAARAGAEIVTWAGDGYPARLRQIPDPPLALFVRGAVLPDELAVAVVGARRAGEYGRRVADELARGLAYVGVTVVSGLATGIDAAAHRGAMAAGGRTVAVMGTGVDQVYPSWHRPLAREIAAAGALVTEFACGTPPLQFHFPKRNRIISGLSVGTVVVEAAERSGSLITANLATEQGREVFAVPGPIGTPHHGGCHRLIQRGAKLVTSVDDVLDEIAPALVARLAAVRAGRAVAALAPTERTVVAALADGVRHVDDIVAAARLDPGTTLETLLALELRGVVEQRPGMRFAKREAA
jgi:DNA processing protein